MDILHSVKKYANEGRLAVICDGEQLTYSELDKMSDAIATYFIKEYKEDKSPIVIHGNKENLILVLMLGALKSGRAYIPLDVTFPVERVKQVIDEVKAKIVINFTEEGLDIDKVYNKESIENIISDLMGQVVSEENWVKDDENAYILFTSGSTGKPKGVQISKNKSIENIISDLMGQVVSEENWVKDDENAYILFTSGSTGKPKGVQISKNNLDSFNNWFGRYMKLDDSNDVIMNQVSYSFDVSVIPIYLGLIHGKTLNSLSKKTLEDFKLLFTNLKESNIKEWVSTPALAEMCIKDSNFNSSLMPNLRTFFFAGEVLSKKLVKELMERFKGVRIINGYGPTEGTVLLSAIDVTEKMLEDERSIPIGYPMEGGILKIVDDNGNTLKDGQKGELIALGKSISKGYFNNEEMTNKVFFYGEVNGKIIRGYRTGDLAYYENGIIYYCGRISKGYFNNEEMTNKVFFYGEVNGKIIRGYRTGDLAYYENGIIYYCGRKDFQIKLNGFRIELEDIENNLRKVSNVNNCVVFPVYKEEKISHLASFVTLKEENELSSLKNSILIKDELKKYIPSYMIPRNIKVLKEFPINTNGKIDRKKLMEELK